MIRSYTDNDFKLFESALLKFGLKSNHKKIFNHLEPGDEALYAKYITGLDFDKYIIDENYFAMVQKNYQWFDPTDEYLDVVMILKIGIETKFNTLMTGLELIAKNYKLNKIVIGTSFSGNDEYLKSLYEKHGYQTCDILLFKKLEN